MGATSLPAATPAPARVADAPPRRPAWRRCAEDRWRASIPSGRLLLRTGAMTAGAAPLSDADIMAHKWGVLVWFELQVPAGYSDNLFVPLEYDSPGIAYIQVPWNLPIGLCPQQSGSQRHPYRISAPLPAAQKGSPGSATYAKMSSSPADYQAGLFASLPGKAGADGVTASGMSMAVARYPRPAEWAPAAQAARAAMDGTGADCSP